MPALVATPFSGTIVWLGRVPHREAPEIVTQALFEMPLTFAGMAGEVHAGLTRLSCSRVTSQYRRGTEIRNTRQISIVSAEELDAIAAALELDAVAPEWLGASIVLRGIPDLTHLPPSSRIQAGGGATLTVDMHNQPCHFPARNIEIAAPGRGKRFKTAAKGRRGITAWVEREGMLRLGDTVTLHIPDQRPWQGLAQGG